MQEELDFVIVIGLIHYDEGLTLVGSRDYGLMAA
jgi:hypothetical protein